MTKVDFQALDRLPIKPLGIYGSRNKIIRFLSDIQALDEQVADMLRDTELNRTGPTLRSGLYILGPYSSSTLYVIYWPEDTTWKDDAISSVQRNRVTFMRYLTKICDQVISLISDEDAHRIVWSNSNHQDSQIDNDSDDDADRLFTFQVAKTNEQEENVSIRSGFTLDLSKVDKAKLPEDSDLDPDLFVPSLVMGETVTGYMNVEYVPPQRKKTRTNDPYISYNLERLLTSEQFTLSESLSEEALQILLQYRLGHPRSLAAVNALIESRKVADDSFNAILTARDEEIKAKLEGQRALLASAIQLYVVKVVLSKYPSLDSSTMVNLPPGQTETELECFLDELFKDQPSIKERLSKTAKEKEKSLSRISKRSYIDKKESILLIEQLFEQHNNMTEEDRLALIQREEDSTGDRSWTQVVKGGAHAITRYIPHAVFGTSQTEQTFTADHRRKVKIQASELDDSKFLLHLQTIANKYPQLSQMIMDTIVLAQEYLKETLEKLTKDLVTVAENAQSQLFKSQLEGQIKTERQKQEDESRRKFLADVKNAYCDGTDGVLVVEDVRTSGGNHPRIGYGGLYHIIGSREAHTDAALRYNIRPLKLTEGDEHMLRMDHDSNFVPCPQIHSGSAFSFRIPATSRMTHLQLLHNERCLLAIEYTQEVLIYLEHTDSIENAVQNSRFKKKLHKEKVGNDFLLAFDESKRMLAVCATDKSSLNVFLFDEKFDSLQGFGSQIDLRVWYSDNQTSLCHAAFLCGSSEELILIDNVGHMRVYSLNTQSFRPTSLELSGIPLSVHSSPDGSCLFTAEINDDVVYLRAYHWSNFGSTTGISLQLQGLPKDSRVMTSIGNRSKVHYVGLSHDGSECKSFILDISRRVTEFTFQERGKKVSKDRTSTLTMCNSLIDCHADVWTRFPVVPAVRRTTANVITEDNPRSLIFVSPLEPKSFQAQLANLISDFERTTRKPTDKELSDILVSGITYEAFKTSGNINISTYKCGEWLVNLLCLIPIHIAVTRDNRFIPLKDGVWSVDLERSLLGATVEYIVDSLSFGWYESIFQSYLASKPVRVVSSMGEQSVGKSFALNHLVDTSFAGSAMRTTEGVWMSVTPTDDSLIVALDFEGVHSIERSAQEDSLLVLFNTAMSNLVLFRNNFALSRDITGLFHSFQSSSTVLDPAANPILFKSTLVIIIKDVVESDKQEITREFSLKFQKIVELEQGSNFITKLHNGNLAIIPWPVIESRGFYTLFPKLKRILDEQPVTHPTGGIFLQTMKTLMAKLKVNDWGALDQNLSSHRAQQLISLLPNALAYGFTELEPEPEPLRDFDSGILIDKPDNSAKFYLADTKAHVQSEEQESFLFSLMTTWGTFDQRFDTNDRDWIEDLGQFLDNLAQDRANHVSEWLQVNTARFKPDSPRFEDVRRLYEDLVISLRANIRLCALQCVKCNLLCLRPKYHEGEHSCHTSHQCNKPCQYVEEHGTELEPCGLPAGHQGNHICEISTHLCGQPCYLQGRRGCLDACCKPVNHDGDEHTCPALMHECGEPCGLSNIKLPGGVLFSCSELCRKPSHEHHAVHLCETRSCPIRCQLCKRLCASSDHLHALSTDAVHLCGQEHPCHASCQSQGICRIETTPQSIEATFTGRHETFQYTKYTQASRRLPCVIVIPAGLLEHQGNHLHSIDKAAFHFCESRCEDCGYFCTLPLGHNQQEHETSHGSMSRTKWAIDGQDGTVLEVNGRKFGSSDDGAPMLCSMVCRDMGRHVHIDYCRSEDASACSGVDLQHIGASMHPYPERSKDFTSHALHWRRTGFKDPYSQEERTSFSKCDSMCSGPEHHGDATGPAQPSFCTLDLFHQPLPAGQDAPGGIGYISRDGHHFSCRNPAQMQQAFHVIFVIDRSSSMRNGDRRPLQNTPVTTKIASRHNNRLGAVFSSLHGFWQARASALNMAGGNAVLRRDAYSVILFDKNTRRSIINDFSSTPDALLDSVLPHGDGRGTNYTGAIKEAQAVMDSNWSPERSPVVIFLSDGECKIADVIVRDLCLRSVARGRPLSFHTVAFGPYNAVLRRMAEVAGQVQAAAIADPMHPTVPSSYTEALDTVRLAETFLGLAESLRKPRGALMRGA
ncbi:hypothetical protein QCA50_020158 [Cerrena zonata]|uniref:VWFA domain-containing protein n=1 Tax=Cerrena zonata TaxID=2478898 RepID=A0AAW0FI87_9APHY